MKNETFQTIQEISIREKKEKGLVAFKSVSSWNTDFIQTPVRHLSVGVIR